MTRGKRRICLESKKVSFLVCGTQKGGTTALDAYLRTHPEICMSMNKEVHFFDNEELFSGERPDYSIYHRCFSPHGDQLLGETTPIYMYWQDAPRRIWEYNPDMRIIVLLRNPIERAYSHWNMERSRKLEHLSFLEAIQRERMRCREALPLQHRIYSYVDRGFYPEQLRRLWRFFSEEQILIIKSEDLQLSPFDTLSRVWRFLGVSDYQVQASRSDHVGEYPEPMSMAAREYLEDVFEYPIRELERLLGWNCSHWLESP